MEVFSISLGMYDDPLIEFVRNPSHKGHGNSFDFRSLQWWERAEYLVRTVSSVSSGILAVLLRNFYTWQLPRFDL